MQINPRIRVVLRDCPVCDRPREVTLLERLP